MKYFKLILLTGLFFVILSCENFCGDDNYVTRYTNIYSYNLDTESITMHCNIGVEYYCENSISGDLYGEGKYYFNSDGTNFISTAPFFFNYNSNLNIGSFDINTRVIIKHIVDSLPVNYDRRPEITYSNDGQMITFSDSLIYSVNVDGSNLTSHTTGSYPSFSTDDNEILYVNENGILSKIDINTNEITELLNDGVIRYPSFHPSGDKIYYFSGSELKKLTTSDSSVTSIYTFSSFLGSNIKYSASGDRKISSYFSIDESDVVSGFGSVYADISPDGTKIACYSQDELWIMDFEGTNKIKLSSANMYEDNIFFAEDGKRIFFIDTVNADR